MPLRSYGVLKATIESRRLATDRSDHYVSAGRGGGWQVAINAHSDDAAVRRRVRRRSRPPATRSPPTRAPFKFGWRALRPGEGLDYVRGGLCKPEQFKPLPLSKPGANNDLNELFDRHMHRATRRLRVRRAVPDPGRAFMTSTRTRATSPSTATTTASGRTVGC